MGCPVDPAIQTCPAHVSRIPCPGEGRNYHDLLALHQVVWLTAACAAARVALRHARQNSEWCPS
eukprot:86396-Chlamydomonas_euryale.AAC.3